MPSEGREGLQTASCGQVRIWRFRFRQTHKPAAAVSIPATPMQEMPEYCVTQCPSSAPPPIPTLYSGLTKIRTRQRSRRQYK
ncbi:TPA: hypothetical protein WH028_000013 [Neisseria meningitidis]|nr:hypothetical protein [Neisseria meningitidis]